MRPFNIIITITITFLLTLSSRAQADWMPVIPGSIERVVAADTTIAAIRDREVWLLREDGLVLRRISRPKPNRATSGAAKQDAQRILDHLDIPEIDRGTDVTDELLDQESTLSERRSARESHAESPLPTEASPALAASSSAIWIAGKDGLVRVETDGTLAPVIGSEFRGSLLAAAEGRLLFARNNRVELLSTSDRQQRRFDLPQKPNRIALSASGERMAWSTSETVTWADRTTARHSFTPAGAVLNLGFCGELLVVALDTGIVVVPPGARPEMRSTRLQVKRVVCPADPGLPWLALGEQVLVSADSGQNWQAIATPNRGILVDIASSAHRLWLATSEGLFTFVQGDAPTSPAPTRTRIRHVPSMSASARWLSWLPKISVGTSANFAPGSRQVQALAFAAFPLDPSPVALPASAQVAEPESESPPPSVPARPLPHAVKLHDPDAECLVLARRKAVALAMSEPERARSYVTRAGRAAWLPELRVLVSRRYGRSESMETGNSSSALSSPLGIDTVNDIRYEARATWDLAKLVFATEELAAQAQALHMAELRRDIETTVNRLYFERRQLAFDRRSEQGDLGTAYLRTGRIEAELDALSGGAFAACVAGKSTREAEAQ